MDELNNCLHGTYSEDNCWKCCEEYLDYKNPYATLSKAFRGLIEIGLDVWSDVFRKTRRKLVKKFGDKLINFAGKLIGWLVIILFVLCLIWMIVKVTSSLQIFG